MEEQKYITLPFMAVVINCIAAAYQNAVCVDIDKHDFAQLVVKDGKQIYQAEDGKQLHYDDANLLQTFGVVESLRTIDGPANGAAYGTTFLANVAFVAIGQHGGGSVDFWRGFSIFKPRQIFFGAAYNSATPPELVNVSGKITEGGATLGLNPVAIAQKYFPGLAEKIQTNQLSLFAVESRFAIRIDNVCDLCLTVKQEI